MRVSIDGLLDFLLMTVNLSTADVESRIANDRKGRSTDRGKQRTSSQNIDEQTNRCGQQFFIQERQLSLPPLYRISTVDF